MNENKDLWNEITLQLVALFTGLGVPLESFDVDPHSGAINVDDRIVNDKYGEWEDTLEPLLLDAGIVKFSIEDDSDEGIKETSSMADVKAAAAAGFETFMVPGPNWHAFHQHLMANRGMSLDDL